VCQYFSHSIKAAGTEIDIDDDDDDSDGNKCERERKLEGRDEPLKIWYIPGGVDNCSTNNYDE
jgi:hypothetical protein